MEENVVKKAKKGPTYFELKKQVKDLTLDNAKLDSEIKDKNEYIKALQEEIDRHEAVNYQLRKEKDMMAEQNKILVDELERMRRRGFWDRIRNK